MALIYTLYGIFNFDESATETVGCVHEFSGGVETIRCVHEFRGDV